MKITRELIQRLRNNNKNSCDLTEEERDAFWKVWNGEYGKKSNILVKLGTHFQRMAPTLTASHVCRIANTYQPKIEAMIKDSEQEETTKVKEKVMEKSNYEKRVVALSVSENGRLDGAETTLHIHKKNGTEYVFISKCHANESLTIQLDEWLTLESAINELMKLIIARGEG